jgi:hypothetical protein
MSWKVHHGQTLLFSENGTAIRSSGQHQVNQFSQSYLSRIEALGSVIRKLRNDDLSRGYCFMIFDENLPEDQAYYEYPDGCIRIEKLDKRNIEIPRVVVKLT